MLKKRYIITLITLIVSVIFSVWWFGKLIENKMGIYVEEEVEKLSKILIRDILDEKFFHELDVEEIFFIDRNGEGEIELIDFDVSKLNGVLGKVNEEIITYFNNLDSGNVDILYEKSTIFEKYMINGRGGLSINIPLGIIFSNPIINSIGPRIPVKLILNGQVESDVVTSIKQYGINNVLLKVDIEIKVREKIVFPFSSRYVNIDLYVPLVIELISGKVPESYLNSSKF